MEAKKSITIISSTMVRPSTETPERTLWLSRLDMLRRQPYSHTNVLQIYEPLTKTRNITGPSLDTKFFDTNILKDSLGKVQVPFYTMAGRLNINKNNRRYEINCNAQGAMFIEAKTTYKLTDLFANEHGSLANVRKGLFPFCDYSKRLSSIPLLLVQLTRFECGGVCLAFSQHHHVADGISHVHFINSWGRLAMGQQISVLPVHDRLNYVAPRDPPQIKFLDVFSHYLEPSLPPMDIIGTMTSTIDRTFKLSEDQINILKQEVISSSQDIPDYKLTTFTVLAAHVWRSACKARKLTLDQNVKLSIPVNGRTILKNPTLPSGYCGNVIACTASKAKAGDVMHKPLSYVVSMVFESITKMKDQECFRSFIDFIETRPSIEPTIRGEYNSTCPNLSINTWAKLLSQGEPDFGWGGPKFIRHGGCRYEGQSALVPNQSDADGSLLLNIRLFTDHMAMFEKYLYEFDKTLC